MTAKLDRRDLRAPVPLKRSNRSHRARLDSTVAEGTNADQVQCRVFETDQAEMAGIATEIADLDATARGRTAVLARNRALLESMHKALERKGVSATIMTRRDDFVSPEMRWLVACMKQIDRPLDRRNMVTLVESFGSFAPSSVDFDELVSRSAADGVTYLSVWADVMRDAELPPSLAAVVDAVAGLAAGREKLAFAIQQVLGHFDGDDAGDDLKEDLSAWRRLSKEIRAAQGFTSLDRFLQEIELRSKEPVLAPGTASLATIHGAKGLEFDTVYLIGLAEEILPSWHSVKKRSGSAALEEERRGCFVAITRTKQRLILSRARQYRGWPKRPSRFLQEMGLLDGGPASGLDSRSV